MDITISSFVRMMLTTDNDCPDWFLSGQQLFPANIPGRDLGHALSARRGYYTSMKSCLAGLVLVCDMSVSIFLSGGCPLTEVVAKIANVRDLTSLYNTKGSSGLPRRVLEEVNETLKNIKVKTIHLGHTKKFVALGPPADDPASVFPMQVFSGTVARPAPVTTSSMAAAGKGNKKAAAAGVGKGAPSTVTSTTFWYNETSHGCSVL
jgi:hypothetical protein